MPEIDTTMHASCTCLSTGIVSTCTRIRISVSVFRQFDQTRFFSDLNIKFNRQKKNSCWAKSYFPRLRRAEIFSNPLNYFCISLNLDSLIISITVTANLRGTQRENFSKILVISFSAFLDCFRAS